MAAITNTNNISVQELKIYFSEPIVDPDSNVLHYWRENSIRLPVMSLMAKDILSMMPTSVSSERAFSIAGLTITKIRANLSPNTANESICLSSWGITFGDSIK